MHNCCYMYKYYTCNDKFPFCSPCIFCYMYTSFEFVQSYM